MMARPVLSLTFATLRTAELGFFGLTVYTALARQPLVDLAWCKWRWNGPFEQTPFF